VKQVPELSSGRKTLANKASQSNQAKELLAQLHDTLQYRTAALSTPSTRCGCWIQGCCIAENRKAIIAV